MNQTFENEDQGLASCESSSKLYSNIERVTLKWENVSLSTKKTQRLILNNLSGYANPAQLLAIMGSSGSGKTSLVSILSNQMTMESDFQITGSITLNHKSFSEVKTSSYIKFVPQDPVLFDFFTPEEFLEFILSLNTNFPEQKVKKNVKKILKLLKLENVASSIIGNNMVRGLSGGEKKRVSIASEIIMQPSVLILDEPTSGLDSSLAYSVVEILKDIAKSGVTVVMTIHQPSNNIFELFDRLILIQNGNFVYQGECSKSIEYFNNLGIHLPKLVNPPDFYMKILRIEDINNLNKEEKRLENLLSEGYKSSEGLIWADINQQYSESFKTKFKYSKAGYLKTLKYLIWRERLNYIRNPLTSKIKLIKTLVLAIIITALYFDLTYDEKGIDNRRYSLVFFIYVFQLSPISTVNMNLVLERKIILNEISEKLYSINSYFLIKILFELFWMIFTVIIMGLCTYYIINLNDTSIKKPLILFAIDSMSYLQGIILGILSAAIARSPKVVAIITSTISIGLTLFSGFYGNAENLPMMTRWIRFCSPYYFLRNAALKNEFDDLDIDDDVIPEPEDRYDIKREIAENIFICFIHFIVFYFIAFSLYWYSIFKMRLNFTRVSNSKKNS